MTDLENGKSTVQMGKLLLLLERSGIKVSLELTPADASAFQAAKSKAQARRAALSKAGIDV